MTEPLQQAPTVEAALASRRSPQVADALREALADARRQLGSAAPAFAIVVATADLCAQKDAFEAALAEGLDGVPHIGTSSAQVEHADAFHDTQTLALLLVAGHAPARLFALAPPDNEEALADADLPDIADAIADLDAPVASVIAFADPRGGHVPLLPRLVERMAPGAALVGGGSTGNSESVQICGGRLLSGVGVGLVLGVPAGPLGVFVAQGAALVGLRGLVTKCEDGVLLEVDGQPATALLESLKGSELPVKVEQLAPLLSLAVAPGGREALDRGDYMVRNLSGVDPQRKAVAAAARLKPGWAVSLALREGIGARSVVAHDARQLAESLGAPAAAGLYFDCASRGAQLYGFDGVDQAQLHKALGAFPLLSVKCSFELGPLRVHEGARPELHLYSGVFWVVARSPARPAANTS